MTSFYETNKREEDMLSYLISYSITAPDFYSVVSEMRDKSLEGSLLHKVTSEILDKGVDGPLSSFVNRIRRDFEKNTSDF